jgi:membrane fusion protein (multidrug efflux system)
MLEISRERLLIAETGPTKEAIEVVENRVTEKEVTVAQAQQRLEDTSVKAPFNGIITGKRLNSGDYVKRGDEVLEITDLSSLEAEMKTPERYANLMKVGIPVTLSIESLLTERKGQITAVNESIDLNTRTFLVKVRIDNRDHSIKAGTFFTGVFQLPPVRDSIAIPTAALRQEGGRSLVWVAEDGRARQLIVVAGEQDDHYVQIRSGLSGDEKVVIAGAGALSEGDSLQIFSPSE